MDTSLGYKTPLDCYSQWLVLPGLRSRPFWDVAEFPFLASLSKQHVAIREELASVLETHETWTLATDHELNVGSENGWTEHPLMWAGHALEKACASFPTTCKLLNSMPEHAIKYDPADEDPAGQATIFRLTPGTKLKPHFGTTNRRLTAHLGLIVPEGPRLRVENETRRWGEGELLVFDDSFRHEVWWDSKHEKKDRFVLSFVFSHPDLWHQRIEGGDEL